MKIILSCLITSLFYPAIVQAKEPGAFSHSTEMIVVTTKGWDSPQGTLRRYERERPGNPWQAVGQPITVMVGKNGLGWGTGVLTPPAPDASDPVKKEGDGKAPAGVFRLSKAFGYAAQAPDGWKMPYVSLTPTIECVDDERSKFYNTLVDTSAVSADWGSHENEKMRRPDDLYRWAYWWTTMPILPWRVGDRVSSCISGAARDSRLWVAQPCRKLIWNCCWVGLILNESRCWYSCRRSSTRNCVIAGTFLGWKDRRRGGRGRHYNAEWTKISWQKLTKDSWRLPLRPSMEKGRS